VFCAQALHAQGHATIPSYCTRGLHPFTIAVAEGVFDVWGTPSSGVLCLLRWPQPDKAPNMPMPLVLMERGSKRLQLVARSIREYVARLLLEEDMREGEHLIAATAT
jgi:hypothetical protein